LFFKLNALISNILQLDKVSCLNVELPVIDF